MIRMTRVTSVTTCTVEWYWFCGTPEFMRNRSWPDLQPGTGGRQPSQVNRSTSWPTKLPSGFPMAVLPATDRGNIDLSHRWRLRGKVSAIIISGSTCQEQWDIITICMVCICVLIQIPTNNDQQCKWRSISINPWEKTPYGASPAAYGAIYGWFTEKYAFPLGLVNQDESDTVPKLHDNECHSQPCVSFTLLQEGNLLRATIMIQSSLSAINFFRWKSWKIMEHASEKLQNPLSSTAIHSDSHHRRHPQVTLGP